MQPFSWCTIIDAILDAIGIQLSCTSFERFMDKTIPITDANLQLSVLFVDTVLNCLFKMFWDLKKEQVTLNMTGPL